MIYDRLGKDQIYQQI